MKNSKETKLKISNSLKDKKRSKEIREKMKLVWILRKQKNKEICVF